MLDDVACTGTETALSDCTSTSNHNCRHSEDVGITCIGIVFSLEMLLSHT